MHSHSSADAIYDCTRVLHIKRQKGDCGPGFTIVGGNAVGIFVHEIQSNSPAASKLQRGDMILKVCTYCVIVHSLNSQQKASK